MSWSNTLLTVRLRPQGYHQPIQGQVLATKNAFGSTSKICHIIKQIFCPCCLRNTFAIQKPFIGRSTQVKSHKASLSLDYLSIDRQTGAPDVLADLFKVVKKKSSTEGIYRASADEVEKRRIIEELSVGQTHSIKDSMDVHLAACLVKQILRDMPQRQKIFPKNVPDLKKLSDDEKRMHSREVITRLSPEKRKLLSAILDHISEITKDSKVNRMTAENLSIVLSPNLFISEKNLSKVGSVLQKQKIFFQYVVGHQQELDL